PADAPAAPLSVAPPPPVGAPPAETVADPATGPAVTGPTAVDPTAAAPSSDTATDTDVPPPTTPEAPTADENLPPDTAAVPPASHEATAPTAPTASPADPAVGDASDSAASVPTGGRPVDPTASAPTPDNEAARTATLEGDPAIRQMIGREVTGADGQRLGRVADLLLAQDGRAVRSVVVELEDGKRIAVPYGDTQLEPGTGPIRASLDADAAATQPAYQYAPTDNALLGPDKR
ncbi:MAG TPA: PRC-barrel domain-containing protein, partial [Azospirillaceae bacterium]|nr:PRC-barrel domain-containing protein [Azospirillaceae bacterium]